MADISPRPQITPARRGQEIGPGGPLSAAPSPILPSPIAPPAPPAPPATAEVVDLTPPANDLETRLRDMLTSEGIERDRAPHLVSVPGGGPQTEGLLASRNELEHRAREGAKMVRMVDRHRQQLERAEQDLETLQERLGQLLPTVTESANALKAAIRSTRRGDDVQSLADQFSKSGASLDELEALAGSLNAQLLWTRSAWEQYCKTVVACQRLRGDYAAS